MLPEWLLTLPAEWNWSVGRTVGTTESPIFESTAPVFFVRLWREAATGVVRRAIHEKPLRLTGREISIYQGASLEKALEAAAADLGY